MFNPWIEKIAREGNGNPLQYSCLKNSMDRGACQATVHEVAKSWTQLSDCHSLNSKKMLICTSDQSIDTYIVLHFTQVQCKSKPSMCTTVKISQDMNNNYFE